MIRRRTFGLSALATAAAGLPARANGAPLKLGTATEGSAFPLYGGAFVDLVAQLEPGLTIRDVPTRGALENLPKLESGELDLGMVSGEVMHEALEGIGRPRTNVKVVTAAFPVPGMFAVLSDSRYRTISDLKGKPVVWNARDSGLAVQGRYMMNGLGFDPDKDFEAIYLEPKNGPAAVLDGRAVALWGGGLRWPGFVALAESARGARYIAPTAEEIERIRGKYPFMSTLTVPAGLYRNQHQPITTAGSWSVLAARNDLPDEVGRKIAAALARAEKSRLLPRQLSETTAKNTLASVPGAEALQPGVRLYYKEQGWL